MRRISSITGRAPSIAIAKLTFWAPFAATVLMPISRPRGVDERPARVAGVDRGVGLEQALEIGPVVRVHRAIEPRDDALGDGRAAAEIEREADGEHAVAEPERRRMPERHGNQIGELRRG